MSYPAGLVVSNDYLELLKVAEIWLYSNRNLNGAFAPVLYQFWHAVFTE